MTMGTGQELAGRAQALARQCLDANRDELVELAAGDAKGRGNAAQVVHLMTWDAPVIERSLEHIAFACLPAAFVVAKRQREQG
jgi:hypothetical protein